MDQVIDYINFSGIECSLSPTEKSIIFKKDQDFINACIKFNIDKYSRTPKKLFIQLNGNIQAILQIKVDQESIEFDIVKDTLYRVSHEGKSKVFKNLNDAHNYLQDLESLHKVQSL